MPTVATVRESSKLSLYGSGGDSGMGGGGYIHHSEDLILAWFLSSNARARNCLGRIGTGTRCCVKPRLISGECVILKTLLGENTWES